jgi:hypothetical protein
MFMMLSLFLGGRTRAPQQRHRMLGDHQLFIGRHDIDRQRFGARDPQRMAGVLRRIKRDPEPSKPFRDPGADAHRVFANAGRENESVDTLQCCGQHPGIQRDAVDKILDSKCGVWIVAGLQLAHVAADTG